MLLVVSSRPRSPLPRNLDMGPGRPDLMGPKPSP
jgi:hypothetical protein